jgi:hypothetical protein
LLCFWLTLPEARAQHFARTAWNDIDAGRSDAHIRVGRSEAPGASDTQRILIADIGNRIFPALK